MNITKTVVIVQNIRDLCERLRQSNKQFENDQCDVLEQIDSDLMNQNYPSACLRFKTIHPSIKSKLPFKVIDFLDND